MADSASSDELSQELVTLIPSAASVEALRDSPILLELAASDEADVEPARDLLERAIAELRNNPGRTTDRPRTNFSYRQVADALEALLGQSNVDLNISNRYKLAARALGTGDTPTTGRRHGPRLMGILARTIKSLSRPPLPLRDHSSAGPAITVELAEELRGTNQASIRGIVDSLLETLTDLPGVLVLDTTESKTSRAPTPEGTHVLKFGLDPIERALLLSLQAPRATRSTWKTSIAISALTGERVSTLGTEIGRQLRPGWTASTRAPAISPESRELLLRARSLIHENSERELRLALSLLDSLLEEEPELADAHGFRAYCLWRMYFAGWGGTSASINQALASCESRSAESSLACQMAIIRICWDAGLHERAVEEATQALKLHPSSSDALLALARAYNNCGMAELSLPFVQRILERIPGEPAATKLQIWNHLMLRNHSTAATIGRAYLRRHPQDTNTPWAVAAALAAVENLEEATSVVQTGLTNDPSSFILLVLLGHVLDRSQAAGGPTKRWRELWTRCEDHPSGNARADLWVAEIAARAGMRNRAAETLDLYWPEIDQNGYLAYRAAHVLCSLDRAEEAMAILRRAYDLGFRSLQLMELEASMCGLRPLRDLPGYADIREQIQLRLIALRSRVTIVDHDFSL